MQNILISMIKNLIESSKYLATFTIAMAIIATVKMSMVTILPKHGIYGIL